jgi:UDP-N-acetylmuramate--alanine ligase
MGIGGVGMCGLAEVAHAGGAVVSGCDVAASERTERLSAMGIEIHIGHDPGHLEGVDTVVYTAAVAREEDEFVDASRRRISMVRRAVMLGELLDRHRGIAVAGTHGKTTTTALIGHLLTEAGLDPTVLVGGRARFADSNARIGGGELMVCEADEYDRSFLELRAAVAVVTNIEPEHLDCYGSPAELDAAFATFCNQTPETGRVVLCRDNEGSWALAGAVQRPVLSYGFSEEADLRAIDVRTEPGRSRFTVVQRGETLGEAAIPIPGRFNILNALAALAVGLELDISFTALAAGCASFTGVVRRFDVLGSRNEITVVDDYAHHPTEIEAVLEAARQTFPGQRLVVVFQPHLYSRTRDFADGFGRALLGADVVVVLPIYPARERPIDGVDEALVVSAATRMGHPAISAGPAVAEASVFVDRLLSQGDVLVTLGAGDVHRVAEEWLRGAA